MMYHFNSPPRRMRSRTSPPYEVSPRNVTGPKKVRKDLFATNDRKSTNETKEINECELEEESIIWSSQETETQADAVSNSYEEQIVTGIINTGNTCYLNAVIQGITHLTLLGDKMEQLSREGDTQLTNEILNIKKTLRSGIYENIIPQSLQSLIKKSSKQFDNKKQQDAHELLMFIINEIIEEDKAANKDENVEKEMENKTERGEIEKLLYGKTDIKRSCIKCEYQAETVDDFNCLYATMPDDISEAVELLDCINDKEENDITYNCEKCTSNEGSESWIIKDYPDITIIQIKRPQYESSSTEKDTTCVDIPHHIDRGRLELKVIIDHIGAETESGHYIAKCWNRDENEWYAYDDDKTRIISQDELQSSDAYLLIYEATKETKIRRSKRNLDKVTKEQESTEESNNIKSNKNGKPRKSIQKKNSIANQRKKSTKTKVKEKDEVKALKNKITELEDDLMTIRINEEETEISNTQLKIQ